MTSAPSDTESNVSSFIRYSDKDVVNLYTSMRQNMEIINQDILEVEKNMRSLMKKAGPLENHLATLLHSFPKTNLTLQMETE